MRAPNIRGFVAEISKLVKVYGTKEYVRVQCSYFENIIYDAVHKKNIFQVIKMNIVVAKDRLERYDLVFFFDVMRKRMLQFFTFFS